MTRKQPAAILWFAAFIGIIITVSLVYDSRFWDSQRVEKAVRAQVPFGSSEKFVTQWLTASGIRYRSLENSSGQLSNQSRIKPHGMNADQLGLLIVGSSKEGFLPDDLYKIDIYFYFDKKRTLTAYRFEKTWVGL